MTLEDLLNHNATKQLRGLMALAKMIGRSEVNCLISPATNSDVAFLQATDTPGASQIVYVSGDYDVWADGGTRMRAHDLSINDAAEVVVTEYFLAKATRIKAHSPHMEIADIMNRLRSGYQRKAGRK